MPIPAIVCSRSITGIIIWHYSGSKAYCLAKLNNNNRPNIWLWAQYNLESTEIKFNHKIHKFINLVQHKYASNS